MGTIALVWLFPGMERAACAKLGRNTSLNLLTF